MSKSLGLILLRAGIITPADLIEAHKGQHDEPLPHRLVALGVATEEQIAHAVAADLHVPNLRIGAAVIEPACLQLVPHALAERHLVCPYLVDGDRLHLVMVNPLDGAAIAAVEQHAGLQVRPAISTPSDVRQAIARSYAAAGAGDLAGRLIAEASTAARASTPPPTRELVPLGRLGLEPEQLRVLRNALDEPAGVILVAGPRGSGRTSTLYASLSQLRCPGLRIVALEERIETRIKGVHQRELDLWSGETTAAELVLLVDENPDAVMIAEIAEAETLATALEAAHRGQLVLGGIHAADAIATLQKLLDLGGDRARIAASLTVLVAQRLVRRLCARCREAYEPRHGVAVSLGVPSGTPAFRARGCSRCDGTGYQGLIGIFEVLAVGPALRDAIRSGAAASVLAREARAAGFVSLQQAAARKVREGITSPEEVFRVMHLDGHEDWNAAPSPLRETTLPLAPVVRGAARHAHKRRRRDA